MNWYSAIAQLVEQLTVNQLVAGSSPACGATFYPNIVIIGLITTFDYQKSYLNIEQIQRINGDFVVIRDCFGAILSRSQDISLG